MSGKAAARVGDMHTCPMSDGPKPHVGGPVLPPGKPTVLIGGMPAATITDLCACASVPDIIMEGAKTVIINGLPASRQYDKTVHGGYITLGCPTVLIGGPSFVDESLLRFRPGEEEKPSKFELISSIGLDLIPFIGTAKGLYEGISGYDLVTGEKLSVAERLIGWVPYLGKAGRVAKNGSKALKLGKKVARGEKAVDIAAKGVLTSFDDVAGYMSKSGNLPSNYITKAQAKALGWNPKLGNLDAVAPGKSIGGDIFKNSEGLLPNASGRTWFEADINYSGGFRGNERLLYSNDGLIYKTTDHYKTFTQIR